MKEIQDTKENKRKEDPLGPWYGAWKAGRGGLWQGRKKQVLEERPNRSSLIRDAALRARSNDLEESDYLTVFSLSLSVSHTLVPSLSSLYVSQASMLSKERRDGSAGGGYRRKYRRKFTSSGYSRRFYAGRSFLFSSLCVLAARM